MAHIKHMIEYLLGKDSDSFMLWAFGKSLEGIKHEDFVTMWNKRHKKKLELSKYGRPEEDIHQMIKVWRKK